MITGKKVGLRAIERSDLSLLMRWRNKESFRQYFREYRELGSENQIAWFEKLVVNGKNTIMFAITDLESNDLLGCCGLCYINWIQRFADLSLYIGWDDLYIDDIGYAKESCELLFNYGFGELGLHKIWTEIYEFDQPKFKLYQELGFHQDGLLRENYYHQGKWHNSRIMSLLAAEWKLG